MYFFLKICAAEAILCYTKAHNRLGSRVFASGAWISQERGSFFER